jgi:hypothetical protein
VIVSGSGPSLDEYMVPCLVFICIEMLHKHFGSALSLVIRASKVYYGASLSEHSGSIWPAEFFDRVLTRLQTQVVGLQGWTEASSTTPPRTTAGMTSEVPDRFSSVAEARDHFEYHTNAYILSRPPSEQLQDDNRLYETETESQSRKWMHIFQRWSTAFDTLRVSHESASLKNQNAIAVLQVSPSCFYDQ